MIKIICIGKMKERYLNEAILEYQKRLSKYTKLKIIELPDSNDNSIERNLVTEKEKIEKYIDERDYIITLEIEGSMMTSLEFSQKIDQIQQHYPNITFIIGGSYGLHDGIKKKANMALSFSKMTFPHPLFRILLLEQIYRSFRILKHESYHK